MRNEEFNMMKRTVAYQVGKTLVSCTGVILALIFPLAEPVFAEGSHEAAFDGIPSKSGSERQSTSPPAGETLEDSSLIIGGGVRRPPDIGASGTASSTPPVRSESPTNEPQILPDVSPVPSHPRTRKVLLRS
ncbi:MAG TPA: hypothetical protein DD706_02690 [Nitrospiraceae bacterium]|nr:hypothetical protein [Nitrospiraceae bacterium]